MPLAPFEPLPHDGQFPMQMYGLYCRVFVKDNGDGSNSTVYVRLHTDPRMNIPNLVGLIAKMPYPDWYGRDVFYVKYKREIHPKYFICPTDAALWIARQIDPAAWPNETLHEFS